MSYQNILVEKRDRIAVLTVNRPQVLNALNAATLEEIGAAIRELGEDDGVGVVIVTGAGEKAFVAGADIAELAAMTAISARRTSLRGQEIFASIENLGKPVIAAVNGYALGGGCELALACTMRVASEKAKIGLPEVTLGIIPGYAGTQRLARLVGKGRAFEIMLTGKPVDAAEAHRIGLVNRVVPAEELMSACTAIANLILANGPIAVRFALDSVNHGLETTLEEGSRLEATFFGLISATEDMHEGLNAFLEKRKPVFKNR
jgi:enoyl-CoA hydratase